MMVTAGCVTDWHLWLVESGRIDLRLAGRYRPPASQGVDKLPLSSTGSHRLDLFVCAGDTPAVIVREDS